MGVVIVKVTGPDAAVGLDTVTLARPRKAVSVAKIAAVSCVALTNVVVRGVPFQLTTDPATKFVPFTTSVKPDEPQYGIEAIGVEDGEIVLPLVLEDSRFGVDVIVECLVAIEMVGRDVQNYRDPRTKFDDRLQLEA